MNNQETKNKRTRISIPGETQEEIQPRAGKVKEQTCHYARISIVHVESRITTMDSAKRERLFKRLVMMQRPDIEIPAHATNGSNISTIKNDNTM